MYAFLKDKAKFRPKNWIEKTSRGILVRLFAKSYVRINKQKHIVRHNANSKVSTYYVTTYVTVHNDFFTVFLFENIPFYTR